MIFSPFKNSQSYTIVGDLDTLGKMEPFMLEVASEEAEDAVFIHRPADRVPAGEEQEIYFQVTDRCGNKFTVGGAEVTVLMKGPSSRYLQVLPTSSSTSFQETRLILMSTQVKDNGDGTYLTNYSSTTAGMHALHIHVNGIPITGTPSLFEVFTGTLYLDIFYVHGLFLYRCLCYYNHQVNQSQQDFLQSGWDSRRPPAAFPRLFLFNRTTNTATK